MQTSTHHKTEAITSSGDAHSLGQFAESVAAREAEFQDFQDDVESTETDEETDTPPPIFDRLYQEGGFAAIFQLCTFTADKFHSIYYIIEGTLGPSWKNRRGRTSGILPKDALLCH